MIFYTFDKESLEYKRVDFKPLLVLPFILLFAVGFRHLYFDAQIIDTTDFRGTKTKTTVENYLKQKSKEQKYDAEYKEFIQNQSKVN